MSTRSLKAATDTHASKEPDSPGSPTYRSGVVARLAGIPVETLRVWERRYGVVGPTLSEGGQRLYTPDDIRRLAVIKQVVDMGHPIGTVAALATEAVTALRDAARTLVVQPGALQNGVPPVLRVALIGPVFGVRRPESQGLGDAVKVMAACGNVANAVSALRGVAVDVAVLELSTLNDTALATVAAVKSALGSGRVLVLYRFGPSAVIRQLRAAGHGVARAPSDALEIAGLCGAVVRAPQQLRPEVNRPATNVARFDDEALAGIAASSTTLYCECPRHLVDLLLSLSGFERYSAECANRGADDARLHQDLQHAAGEARAVLEAALVRVAVAEGIALPSSTQPGERAVAA